MIRTLHYGRYRVLVYRRGQHFIWPAVLLAVGVGLAASPGGADGAAAMLALTALPFGFAVGATYGASDPGAQQQLALAWLGRPARVGGAQLVAVAAITVGSLGAASALLGAVSGSWATGAVALVASMTSAFAPAIWGLALQTVNENRPAITVLAGLTMLTLTIPLCRGSARWLVSPAPRFSALHDGHATSLLWAGAAQGVVAGVVALAALAAVRRSRTIRWSPGAP